jgi:hypothetical protein
LSPLTSRIPLYFGGAEPSGTVVPGEELLGALWLPDDGEDIDPGVVVSPAFGCDGELCVSTGGAAVDGDALGLEFGYVDGADVLGLEFGYADGADVLGREFGLEDESGTVDGVDVPGTAGVDWDGVPVDGAGAEDGAL